MTTDLDTLLTALHVGNKGFAGRDFEDLVTGEYRLRLVRPTGATRRPGTVHRVDPAGD